MSGLFRSLLALSFLICAGAQAQDYPNRPIRLIVGYAPGGGMDTLARLLGEKLGAVLGQSVVIDNQPGAGGTVAAVLTKNAAPDGYTLHLAETGLFISPILNPKAGYDPVGDFAPVALVGSSLFAIVANPSVPAADIRDLVALLKAEPDKYSYGTPGVGSGQHMIGELFKRAAGVTMVHVPYKGGAPALADVMAGSIPLAIVGVTTPLAQANAGKIKILAVTGAERLPTAPQFPTLSETIPGLEASPVGFILAPKDMPAAAVVVVREAMARTVADPEVRKALFRIGFTPSTKDAAAFAQDFAAEAAKWTEIAKDSGLKAE